MTKITLPYQRRQILLQIYDSIKHERDSGFGYSAMHQKVKELQDRLEEHQGLTLGYRFDSENFFGVWDDKLQEDLELLDLIKLVNNDAGPCGSDSPVKDYDLFPRNPGRLIAEIFNKAAGGKIQGKSRTEISKLVKTVSRQ